MKKNFVLVGVLAVSAILFTGCSAKETNLVCSLDSSGVNVEFDIKFKGDDVESMNLNYDMNLESYSDLQIEAVGAKDFCSVVMNSMKDYKEAFSNCKQEIVNKHLQVKSEFDIEKLSSDVQKGLKSPVKAKEAFEASGYTCTEK